MTAALDLGSIPGLTLPPLPADLVPAVVATPLARAWCPYCGKPVAGLLAGCTDGHCKRLELDADDAYKRSLDHD